MNHDRDFYSKLFFKNLCLFLFDIEGSNPSHASNVTLTAKKIARFVYCVCGVEVSTFNLLKGSGSNPDIKSVMNFKEK